ncbi:MAG: hypothetical protein LIO38_07765, partial [Cloacibacillus sp.]|nr:hypothetical protein [Cloacibacillus sp.]
MTPALKAKLSANLETLRDFGAALCGCDTLAFKTIKLIEPQAPEAAPRASVEDFFSVKRVIGRREVVSLPAGSLLRVSKNALVTQLAYDAAFQRGVRIEKEV